MDFLTEHVTFGSRVRMAIRWVLGLWLIVHAARGISGIEGGSSHLGVFALALFAFGKGILGVLLIAPDLATWAATPLLRFIDSIYLPNDSEQHPPLDYRLADYYRTSGQHDEAIAHYREITDHYPREGKAFGWWYFLTAYRKHDLRGAGKVLRQARRRLRGRGGWDEFKRVVRGALAGDGETASSTADKNDPGSRIDDPVSGAR